MPSSCCHHNCSHSKLSFTDLFSPSRSSRSKTQLFLVRGAVGPPELFVAPSTSKPKQDSRPTKKVEDEVKDEVKVRVKAVVDGKEIATKDSSAEAKNEAAGVQTADEWTGEQDKKLLDMKLAGNTWAQIVEAIGKSKSTAQLRWKEIRPQDAIRNSGAKPVKDGTVKAKGEKTASASEQKSTRKDVNAESTSNKKKDQQRAHQEKGKAATQHKHGLPTPPSSVASIRTNLSRRPPSSAGGEINDALLKALNLLNEDGNFSAAELQHLYQLVREDESQKWARVKDRFFDQTGRRMHEDDVKDKVRALYSSRSR